MANVCSFTMKARGKTEEALESFRAMIEQSGKVWMGRGAEVYEFELYENEDDGLFYAEISGDTKWSVHASLINDAVDMRENPTRWSFGDDTDGNDLAFVTIYEACEQLGIDMECYAETPESDLQEHLLFEGGQIVVDAKIDCPYEYDEEDGTLVTDGGYGDWTFEL